MPPRTERASPAERQASPKRGESLESPVHRSIRVRCGCSKFQHGKAQNSTNNCWFWWKTFQIWSSRMDWCCMILALACRSEVPDEMCWAVGAWLSGCPVDYHPFFHWRLLLSPYKIYVDLWICACTSRIIGSTNYLFLFGLSLDFTFFTRSLDFIIGTYWHLMWTEASAPARNTLPSRGVGTASGGGVVNGAFFGWISVFFKKLRAFYGISYCRCMLSMWWEKRCINIGITLIFWSNTPSIYGYTPIFFMFFCHVATLMDSCSLGGCTRLSQTLHPRTSRQGTVYFLADGVAFGWPKWCEAQLYHVLSGRHFSVVEWRYFVTHLRFFQGPSFFDAYPTRLLGNMMG